MFVRGQAAACARVETAAFLLIFAFSVWGQTPTGEITGTVTDSSGAVLVDATVTIVNPATNASRVTKTNEAGVYDVPALPPGTYSITIERQGFNSEVRNNIELRVAQIAKLDSVLQPGNLSEKVEVTGGAPVLETESTSVGTVIENQRIVELPLNGRNYLSLTALTPGVSTTTPVNQVASSRQGGLRGSFSMSAAGQRSYFNHYTLDGAENTDPNFNAFLYLPSLDALQEFKVETGVTPAEYGHNLTQINVTSKSGTNALHGSLFEFIRNSAVDAKNYFDRATAPIPRFQRNQFGGTVGGAIKKDKIFFFFDYEGLRERKALTRVATVPTDNQRHGIFTTNVTIPHATGTPAILYANNTVTGISPITTAYLNTYVPLPNIGGINNSAPNNYVTALLQPNDNDQFGVRGDYLQSANSTWMLRYAHTREYLAVPGSFPLMGQINDSHAQQGMLGNIWLFGPTKVNDFKFVVNYINNLLPGFNSNKNNVVAQLGIPNYPTNVPFNWGVPSPSATGFTLGGEGGGTFADWDGVGQITDSFSWIHGKHAFKFGGEVSRTRYNGINGTYSSGIYNATGQYTGNAFADLLLGDFGVTSGLFGSQTFNLRWLYVGLYAEDSWKITPKLTVNYGIRWEDQTPPVDVNDAIVNVAFNWNSSFTPILVRAGNGDPYAGSAGYPAPPGIQFVRDGRFGNNEFNNDPKNFAPRLGVAYSLTPKTVIRAGSGIFFAHDIGNGYLETNRNIPFSLIQKDLGNPGLPNLTWNSLFPPPALPSFTSAIERYEPTARVYQWNFGIQRQVYSSASLEVTYVGSAGNYLPRISTYNTAPPGPGAQVPRSPFPQFGGGIQVIHPSVHSNYNALQARFEQRLSHGFTVLNSFSWGKSMDNGSSLRPISTDAENRDPNNGSDIRGLSSFSFSKRFSSSFLYELPIGKGKALLGSAPAFVDAILGGWQLSGIITLQDGLPFSAFCGNIATFQNGGTSGTQPTSCYPNSTGQDPNLSQGSQDPKHWYNLAAFANQTPFHYGNAGRNTIIGPGIIDIDASIAKTFRVTERQHLEIRAEFFNVGNHPLWGYPGSTVGAATNGVISNTIIDARELQGGVKYSF